MGSKPKRRRNRISKRLVVSRPPLLLLLLLSGSLVSLPAQEPPETDIEFSETLLSPGERTTVELFVPNARVDELDFFLPVLPDRLSLVGEPLLTESRRRVGSSVVLGVLIILQIEAEAAGRTLFPPLRVEGAGIDPIVTDATLVEISSDGTPGGVPFDLLWRWEDTKLLPGETTPVYLEMRNLLEIRYPDEILVDAPETGVFEEVRGLGEVSSQTVGETTLYTVPVAVFLLTPTEAGSIRLPAALVRLGELERSSESVDIAVETVQTAPDSGAIGSFDFHVSVSREEGILTEPFTLSMRLTGAGNLPFVGFPEVMLENLIELDRQEESRQVPTTAGYEGERTLSVRIAPGEGPMGSVTVDDFDFVDPASLRRVVIPGSTFEFSLAGGAAAPGSEDSLEIPFASRAEIVAETLSFSYRDSSSYLLFLIGPGFLLVVAVSLVIQRRRLPTAALLLVFSFLATAFLSGQAEELERRVGEAARLVHQGDYEEAQTAYEELSARFPWNAALHYNLGAAAYYAGNRGVAIYGFREAARYAQGEEKYWTVLRQIEETYGLDQQLEITRFVDPDTLLIGLLILGNIGLPLVVLFPVRAKGQRVIAASLFLLLVVIGGTSLLQAYRIEDAGRGVVSADKAEVLRIPEPDADAWLSLKEGTAVQVELRHERFLLVRTGLGVEGWIEARSVLRPWDQLPSGGSK